MALISKYVNFSWVIKQLNKIKLLPVTLLFHNTEQKYSEIYH